jgi:hypothetical protein
VDGQRVLRPGLDRRGGGGARCHGFFRRPGQCDRAGATAGAGRCRGCWWLGRWRGHGHGGGFGFCFGGWPGGFRRRGRFCCLHWLYCLYCLYCLDCFDCFDCRGRLRCLDGLCRFRGGGRWSRCSRHDRRGHKLCGGDLACRSLHRHRFGSHRFRGRRHRRCGDNGLAFLAGRTAGGGHFFAHLGVWSVPGRCLVVWRVPPGYSAAAARQVRFG